MSAYAVLFYSLDPSVDPEVVLSEGHLLAAPCSFSPDALLEQTQDVLWGRVRNRKRLRGELLLHLLGLQFRRFGLHVGVDH